MAEDESTIFQTTAAAAATDDDDYDAEAVVTDAEAVVARPPPLLTQQEQQQEAKQQAQGRRKSRRISLRAMLEDGPGNDDDEEEDDFQYEGDDNAKNSKKSIIGMRETKAVFILKLIVVLVLILSATIVGTSTFLFLSRNEDQQFQLQYKEDAYKILEAMGSSLDKTLGLLDSVAVQLDSHATSQQQQQQESSSSWPFVTLPDFAVKLSKIFPLTDAIVVNVHPLVRNDQREAWENYAQNNNAWVDESMAVQAEWEGYYGPVTFNGTLNLTTLHSDFEDLPYNLTYVLYIYIFYCTRALAISTLSCSIHGCLFVGMHTCIRYMYLHSICYLNIQEHVSHRLQCFVVVGDSRDYLPLWQNFPVIANVRVHALHAGVRQRMSLYIVHVFGVGHVFIFSKGSRFNNRFSRSIPSLLDYLDVQLGLVFLYLSRSLSNMH